MQINMSQRYDKFKFLNLNRKINKSHVEELKELNRGKKRFELFPIVVDKEMNIIDGQHRYQACKELNIPVYYIVDNYSSENKFEEITKVNTASRSHTYTEIFDMLVADNDRVAIEILSYISMFKERHDFNINKFQLIKIVTICGGGKLLTTFPSGVKMKRAMQLKQWRIVEDVEERILFLIDIIEKGFATSGDVSFIFKALYLTFKRNSVPMIEGLERMRSKGFAKNESLKGLTYNQICNEVVRKYNQQLPQNKKIAI